MNRFVLFGGEMPKKVYNENERNLRAKERMVETRDAKDNYVINPIIFA